MTNSTVAPLAPDAVELVVALLLEGGIADGQHLVDQEDLGVDVDHHREREPHEHARGVVLHLQVDEVAEFGEVDHAVEAPARLAGAEAEHGRVEHRVVARRQVGVEADPELDERRHAPVDVDRAAVDAVDPGQALQQRRLARAVAPDDAEELARLHGEGHAAQRVQDVVVAAAERVQRALLERADLLARDLEALVDTVDYHRRDLSACSSASRVPAPAGCNGRRRAAAGGGSASTVATARRLRPRGSRAPQVGPDRVDTRAVSARSTTTPAGGSLAAAAALLAVISAFVLRIRRRAAGAATAGAAEARGQHLEPLELADLERQGAGREMGADVRELARPRADPRRLSTRHARTPTNRASSSCRPGRR